MSDSDRNLPRHLLFVYGTLKTGFCRNPYLDEQQLVGPVQTANRYRLVDCGNFPGLIVDFENGISMVVNNFRKRIFKTLVKIRIFAFFPPVFLKKTREYL